MRDPKGRGKAMMPADSEDSAVTRRWFLSFGPAAGAGLAIGCWLPEPEVREEEDPQADEIRKHPSLWIRITPDDLITVALPRAEMGQGISTALPMLVCEKLDADWENIRTEWAPLSRSHGRQLTAASDSLRTLWLPFRQVGALAREMLITAAAEGWGVETTTCRAERGRVVHDPTGRTTPYGALADRAARLPLPKEAPLKRREDFRRIGTSIPRLDVPEKSTGRAIYGWDVTLPGLMIASVRHSPVLGGSLRRFDDGEARAVPGVRAVVPLTDERKAETTAIAVVAESFWTAERALKKLELEWDEGEHAAASSATLEATFRELAGYRPRTVSRVGAPRQAMLRASRHLEAVYETPYLAHAAMETMNCTARVSEDSCEIWVPTQNPAYVRKAAARLCNLPRSAVTVHRTYLGGGFGRRQRVDTVTEAVQIAKAVGSPVKVLWSREEDMRHAYYRPAGLHQLRAGLDGDGLPFVWTHRIAGVGGSDALLVQGIDDVPYAIPHQWVTLVRRSRGPLRTGPWRGLARSQNTFATECFLDEVAHAAGLDPVDLRARLLSRAPRFRAVLELAAERAGWKTPVPGRHRGIALGENFGAVCAQVAEVSIAKGKPRVHRVVCAVDCGQVVNPDIARAQIEGGIVFGLSAALGEEIAIESGRVQQSSFDDYPVLRMPEAPEIEVYLVPSVEPPAGIGETSGPVTAPAVGNACFAATGMRIRRLPIRLTA
jgi:isoquinoline 1-oxidoreductase beta subunit